ncbi:hypothetical protein QBC38DRAFT_538802 [Podospora fimiseda]|uniref:Uncharacterized protein n=1 Tax=Podospora fimiseda TaxID=252190 RepID=A0AAN7GSZ1_9PEZI|nr:hypothetical protein QBC38DRAFT_538802 [Podospora fimiseda]
MPNLVSIDVSVTDSRVSLVFSHRAVAAAYASYLRAQDSGRPSGSPFSSPGGYYRAPHFSLTAKEVTLSLPQFITWFITCRLPDDEDSVTFTFMDVDEIAANRWADSMVLFERVPVRKGEEHNDGVNELHVRRLWNKDALLKRLEELTRQRKIATGTMSPSRMNCGDWRKPKC